MKRFSKPRNIQELTLIDGRLKYSRKTGFLEKCKDGYWGGYASNHAKVSKKKFKWWDVNDEHEHYVLAFDLYECMITSLKDR